MRYRTGWRYLMLVFEAPDKSWIFSVLSLSRNELICGFINREQIIITHGFGFEVPPNVAFCLAHLGDLKRRLMTQTEALGYAPEKVEETVDKVVRAVLQSSMMVT